MVLSKAGYSAKLYKNAEQFYFGCTFASDQIKEEI